MEATVWLESPIGPLEITASAFGVQRVRKVEKAGIEPDGLPFEHLALEAKRQLSDYFEGKRRDFDLKIDFGGANDFSRACWQQLQKIPFGKTVSYSFIAEKLGQPTAVRAVGMANRSNPVAIVVPCHRVIGKAGELRGYFYGLDTKMQLLRHENPVRFVEQTALF